VQYEGVAKFGGRSVTRPTTRASHGPTETLFNRVPYGVMSLS
jgi:hypothetical protein